MKGIQESNHDRYTLGCIWALIHRYLFSLLHGNSYYATEPFRVQAPGASAPLPPPPLAALAKLVASFKLPPEGPLVLVLLSPVGGPVLFKRGGGGALEPNFSFSFSFSFSFGWGGPELPAKVGALRSDPRGKICFGADWASSASEGAREV